ncbi:unnamed protein product [Trichobilharzia szidati]|nr:unnamed protein product [Trichobilharzia szidati]
MLVYIFLLSFVTTVKASGTIQQCQRTVYAIATFNGTKYAGSVYFTRQGPEMHITGSVSGLPNNKKLGVHIHEYGTTGNNCLDAGPHFNPFDSNHGGLTGSPRHPGDLGNLQVDAKGVMHFDLKVDISALYNYDGFLGRAIVIHANEDDLGLKNNEGSRATGNSGQRLTCAVIGIWKA